jgi:hypothetical protein
VTALGAVVAWTTPVVLATVAGSVFTGHVDAPLLVLVLVVAPLVALLPRPVAGAATEGPAAAGVAHVIVATPGWTLVLTANVIVVMDLARLLGIGRGVALAIGLGLVLLPLGLGGDAEDWSGALGAAGIAAVLGCLVVVALVIGVSPLTAWRDFASRPSLTFGERSVWVVDGHAFTQATTLAFTESQRVTALTPGTYRVVENGGGRAVARDRRVALGDSLVMRPGDRLVVEAGARLRFERDKPVPGAAVSGMAWADPRRRASVSTLVRAVGVALSLIGGALALLRPLRGPSRLVAVVAPAAVLAFVLGSAGWGLYAAFVGPDLALGAPSLAAIVRLPAAVVPARDAAALVSATATAIAALTVASACGLARRMRVVAVVKERSGPGRARWSARTRGAWVVLAGLAGLSSLWLVDAWSVFVAGTGFLTATWVAPALAAADRRATLIGALVGATMFALVVAGAWVVPAWSIAGHAAVLIAAPVAWLAARLTRSA